MYGEVINSKERYKKKKHVEFSPQEKIVMQLICKEYSRKEIATYMNLATRTIDHYRENILEKIGGKNVVGIALYAIVHEVVNLSDILQYEEIGSHLKSLI